MYLYKKTKQTINQTYEQSFFCHGLDSMLQAVRGYVRTVSQSLNITSFSFCKIVCHILSSSNVLFIVQRSYSHQMWLKQFFWQESSCSSFYRWCCVPGMGLPSGFNAGWPPGPRPWMSTLGTRGLWRPGCGCCGVRYILLYIAAAAAAAVVLSMVPNKLGW